MNRDISAWHRKFLFFSAITLSVAVYFISRKEINAQQKLSSSEERKLAGCEAGIKAKNPQDISACVSEPRLFDRLFLVDAGKAGEILEKANAIKDMADLLESQYYPESMRDALILRLDGNNFAPAVIKAFKLKVPPGRGCILPEQLIPWIEKHRKETLAIFREAALTWDFVKDSPAWTNSGYNHAQQEWENLPLTQRKKIFRGLEELEKLHTAGGKVSGEKRQKLEQEYLKAQEKISKMGSLPVEKQLNLLDKLFDSSPDWDDSKEETPAFQPKPNDDPDYAGISGILTTAALQEIAGTKAGSALIESLGTGTKIKIEIGDIPAGHAGAYTGNNEIIINQKLVESWMESNDYSLKDMLLNDRQLAPAPVKRLARFLAPVIVHEGTHMEQAKWLTAKDMEDRYPHSDEIEAFSMSALYVLEKVKADRLYFAKTFNPEKGGDLLATYVDNQIAPANELYRDYNDFKRNIYHLYSKKPSFEAEASRQLRHANAIADELEKRKVETLELTAKEKAEIDALRTGGKLGDFNPDDLKNAKTSVLKDFLKYYRYWYSEMSKRIEKSGEFIARTSGEITGAGNTSTAKTIPPSPVPAND